MIWLAATLICTAGAFFGIGWTLGVRCGVDGGYTAGRDDANARWRHAASQSDWRVDD